MRCARSWRTARRTIQPMSGLWCDAKPSLSEKRLTISYHSWNVTSTASPRPSISCSCCSDVMPIATIPTRSSRIESTSSPFASWSLKSRSIEPSESAPFDSFTLYSETLTIDVMSVTIEHTSADMYACVMSVHTPMRGTCSPGVADARGRGGVMGASAFSRAREGDGVARARARFSDLVRRDEVDRGVREQHRDAERDALARVGVDDEREEACERERESGSELHPRPPAA